MDSLLFRLKNKVLIVKDFTPLLNRGFNAEYLAEMRKLYDGEGFKRYVQLDSQHAFMQFKKILEEEKKRKQRMWLAVGGLIAAIILFLWGCGHERRHNRMGSQKATAIHRH